MTKLTWLMSLRKLLFSMTYRANVTSCWYSPMAANGVDFGLELNSYVHTCEGGVQINSSSKDTLITTSDTNLGFL